MTTVFHYTDVDAFVSILKSRQLWMTDTRAMNDTTEKLDFLVMFRDRLSKEPFQHESVKNEILSMTDFVENNDFGVLSFSTDKDTLPQWVAYGGKGEGFSIGFDPSPLTKIVKRSDRGATIILRDIVNTFVGDVIYESDKKSEIVEDLIQTAKSMEPRRARIDTRFDSFRSKIIKNSCSFKNKCFKEEKEIRLVKWFRDFHANDSELYEKGFIESHYDHRSVAGIPRLYYKHDFEPEWITEIVLGPKCPASIPEIKKFILELGYPSSVEVTRSLATYR